MARSPFVSKENPLKIGMLVGICCRDQVLVISKVAPKSEASLAFAGSSTRFRRYKLTCAVTGGK
jgi:hypothetical protein